MASPRETKPILSTEPDRAPSPFRMLKVQVQPRRLSRPKAVFYLAILMVAVYCLLLRTNPTGYQIPSWHQDAGASNSTSRDRQHAAGATKGGGIQGVLDGALKDTHGGSHDSTAHAGSDRTKEKEEDEDRAGREAQWDANQRLRFEQEEMAAGLMPGAGAIYGSTLATLDGKEERRAEFDADLGPEQPHVAFSMDKPTLYSPYPKYSSKEWREGRRGAYVPCIGPTGREVGDISVFKGHPYDFPDASFGSFEALNIDKNLCFERDTRLSPYGLNGVVLDQNNRVILWDNIDWGTLQDKCVEQNKARFDLNGSPNPWVAPHYGDLTSPTSGSSAGGQVPEKRQATSKTQHKRESSEATRDGDSTTPSGGNEDAAPEQRTALLLRSYTGKQYSDNDKQTIRSLISELSLRTGGEYQVFLLLQVKIDGVDLADGGHRDHVLASHVPREFHTITVMWDGHTVQSMYPRLDEEEEASVHNAQWLSVQWFMQQHREFDYVWNWELDSRLVGHNYDTLSKLATFARKQPRRGLWERNERFYIPTVHGDYDTTYRKEVERASGSETVWGAPQLPFIRPVGPAPPVSSPADDDYEWGVGEEADVISLSPMFNPINSNWVLADQVWNYNDTEHPSKTLPRRTTIITQSRLSRRLLDIMHVENLRGNHVGSEMATNTVALLHGLKAVYAPMPVYFDRPWRGEQLAKWFNGGSKGVSGGYGSAMGWGREGRYRGSTWYYRADPPQRLYNNWMGYEDTEIGGTKWEEDHGRPCLPPLFLHPIKDVKPTEPGHTSESKLPYP